MTTQKPCPKHHNFMRRKIKICDFQVLEYSSNVFQSTLLHNDSFSIAKVLRNIYQHSKPTRLDDSSIHFMNSNWQLMITNSSVLLFVVTIKQHRNSKLIGTTMIRTIKDQHCKKNHNFHSTISFIFLDTMLSI